MKNFNCPYCDERFNKIKLLKHIEKEHKDQLPLGYTPYRMVYDVVNDKHGHGNCVVCGKPTKWNEKRQKYNRLCGDPKCYEQIKKTYHERMMRVYNKPYLLDDPKFQEKMLAHRKISGKYKWSDGKEMTYTGTYEKKLMEFLDKVLEYKSNEVIAPGPILEYEFKGKKLHWITDFLIIPYNLIIEVKDGGNNPNTRSMPIYRAKQVAKEKMITNMGTYSYIRLTNNDFGQLLSILAELKMNVVDHNDSKVYRIHENQELLYDMIKDKVSYLDEEECSIERREEIIDDPETDRQVKAVYTIRPKYINKSKLKKFENDMDKLSKKFEKDKLFDFDSFFKDPIDIKEGYIIGLL